MGNRWATARFARVRRANVWEGGKIPPRWGDFCYCNASHVLSSNRGIRFDRMNIPDREDLITYILATLRTQPLTIGRTDGFDVYLSNTIYSFLQQEAGIGSTHQIPEGVQPVIEHELVPRIQDAVWELCRRGLLRPGNKTAGILGTDGGTHDFQGFSLTKEGKEVVSNSDDYIHTEPGGYGALLEVYRPQFGDVFMQRAMEAARCFNGMTYFACCVMCGAAAEAILFQLAVSKTSEEEATKKYQEYGGRKELIKMIVDDSTYTKGKFGKLLDWFVEWRDLAGHASPEPIGSDEARLCLRELILFARFVRDNWPKLIAAPSKPGK